MPTLNFPLLHVDETQVLGAIATLRQDMLAQFSIISQMFQTSNSLLATVLRTATIHTQQMNSILMAVRALSGEIPPQQTNTVLAAISALGNQLQQEITTMSTTLSGQVDDDTASLMAAITAVGTEITAIGSEVDALIAQVAAGTPPVGSTVTADQVAALDAVVARMNDLKTRVEAIPGALPTPPAPAPAP